MISHVTIGIPTTEARAGVGTLLSFASFVGGTVNIVQALWVTVGGSTKHASQAGAVTPRASL